MFRIVLLLSVFLPISVVAEAPLPVSVAPVSAAKTASTLPLAGELRAIRATLLSAELAGVVDKVLLEAGDKVGRGAELAQLRRKPANLRLRALRAEVAEAKAGVDRAAIRERRIGGLLTSKAVSQDDYDVAKVELAQARAQLAAREAAASQQLDTLARHSVRAPFAGVLTARHVEAGQWLAVGDPVFALADVTVLRAVFAVPQQYFGRLRKGIEVKVQVDALKEVEFSGVISAILPAIERAGRSFTVWIDIANADNLIAAGMSARVALPVYAAGDPALLVPRDALMRDANGGTTVWVIDRKADGSSSRSADDKGLSIRRLRVSAQSTKGGSIVVNSTELGVGDQVVVRGNESLREGMRVRATPFKPAHE